MTDIDKDQPLPPPDAIVIERDIPEPPPIRAKYPFKQMEVGDSFFFTEHLDSISSIRQRIFDKAGNKMTFTIRKDGHGWRIWRIK